MLWQWLHNVHLFTVPLRCCSIWRDLVKSIVFLKDFITLTYVNWLPYFCLYTSIYLTFRNFLYHQNIKCCDNICYKHYQVWKQNSHASGYLAKKNRVDWLHNFSIFFLIIPLELWRHDWSQTIFVLWISL